jgi:microcompartment protein CcmK/EutM
VNLGVVRGTVVCEHRVAELVERRLVIVQQVDEDENETGRPVVALDPVVSAAEGALVWFVSGSDATDALADPMQPADAAIVGLVSSIRRAGR